MVTKRVMARKAAMASNNDNHDNVTNRENDNNHDNNGIKDDNNDDGIDDEDEDNNDDDGDKDDGDDDDLFQTAWTIPPTLFLGSTFGFGIAKNDNTKDNREKEERGWAGEIKHNA
jgi:hypothetical protein